MKIWIKPRQNMSVFSLHNISPGGESKLRVPRNLVRSEFLILLLILALVLLINWRITFNLSTGVVGNSSQDGFEVLWQLSWVRQALFERAVSPVFTPYIFYPHGWYLASGAQPVWWMIVLAPLAQIFGVVATYNLALLGAFLIGGYGMYWLLKSLTARRLPGLLAAAIYITTPQLTMRLGGHLHILFSAMWLPYVALACHAALQSIGTRRRHGWLLAGICLALSMLGHWQFVFMSPLIVVCIILFSRGPWAWRVRWLLLVRIGGLAILLILPFAALTGYARSQMFTTSDSFSIFEADAYSISPDRLLAPSAINGIWGNTVWRLSPPQTESDVISLGYVATVFALVGVWKSRARSRPYLVLVVMTIVLAMGITLHWSTKRVEINLPDPLAAGGRATIEQLLGSDSLPQDNRLVIPLPAAVLARILPFADSFRVWGRYIIVAALGIAVLAGFGWQWFQDRSPTAGRWLGPILMGIILVEGIPAPYRAFTPVEDNTRETDRWLTTLPADTTVMEYPFPEANLTAMYRQSIHGKRVVNGYMSILPTYLVTASAALGQWPTEQSLPILRDWKVDYVIVNGGHSGTFQTEILPRIEKVKGLCLARVDETVPLNRAAYVFKVQAPNENCEAPGLPGES